MFSVKRIFKKVNPNLLAKVFVSDSEKIVAICREKKLPENVIEEIQEKYLEFLILACFKCSGMPKVKKLKIAKDILKRL